MLYINSQAYEIYTAIGQYVSVSVRFFSDTMLTGKMIRLNPGIYKTNEPFPEETCFYLKYSAVAGTYEFSNYGCKNHKAFLKVTDSQNFEIEYRFFVTKSLGGWMPEVTYNYSSIFDAGTFSTMIGLYVKASTSEIVATIPISVMGNGMEIDFDDDGFLPGVDCDIEIKAPNGTASNFYIAIIKNDAINNNQNIMPGLIQSYCQVGNGVKAIYDLESDYFTQGWGFIQVGDETKALVTINGEYLKAGSTYTMYVVYFYNGEWRHGRSNILKPNYISEPIVPVVTYSITDEFSNTTNAGCLKGISNEIELDISITIDTTNYNQQLALRGISGTFETRFESSKVFKATTQGAYSGTNIRHTKVGNAFEISEFKTKEKNIFVILKITMNMPGYKDYIFIPVELVYDAPEDNKDIAVYEGEAKVDVLCDGGEYTIKDDFTGCTILQSINGADYSENTIITGFDIDELKIPLHAKACFKIICDETEQDEGGDDDGSEGDCQELCDQITLKVTIEQELTMESDYYCYQKAILEIIGGGNIVDSTITWGNMTLGAGGWTSTGSFMNGKIEIQTDGYFTDDPSLAGYVNMINIDSVEVEFEENGCKYNKALSINLNSSVYAGVGVMTTEETYLIDAYDCDDIPDAACDNVVSIEYTCDYENETITITLVKNFEATVKNEVYEFSFDNGKTWVAGTEEVSGQNYVLVRYQVTFVEACDPIILNEVIDCMPINIRSECSNERTIELLYENDALTINITTDFESPIDIDTLYISLDNGVTYTEYDPGAYVPIALNGTEKIVVYTETFFADEDCDKLIVTETLDLTTETENEDCEGYAGYSISASYNAVTGKFSVTKNGSEANLITNELAWTLNGGNPFDINNTGVLYSEEVEGEGVFIARWKIKKQNCAEIIFDAIAFGTKKTKVICILNRSTGNEFVVTDIDLLKITDPSADLEVIVNTTVQEYVSADPPASGQYTITTLGKLKFFLPLTNATIKITQYPYL